MSPEILNPESKVGTLTLNPESFVVWTTFSRIRIFFRQRTSEFAGEPKWRIGWCSHSRSYIDGHWCNGGRRLPSLCYRSRQSFIMGNAIFKKYKKFQQRLDGTACSLPLVTSFFLLSLLKWWIHKELHGITKYSPKRILFVSSLLFWPVSRLPNQIKE